MAYSSKTEKQCAAPTWTQSESRLYGNDLSVAIVVHLLLVTAIQAADSLAGRIRTAAVADGAGGPFHLKIGGQKRRPLWHAEVVTSQWNRLIVLQHQRRLTGRSGRKKIFLGWPGGRCSNHQMQRLRRLLFPLSRGGSLAYVQQDFPLYLVERLTFLLKRERERRDWLVLYSNGTWTVREVPEGAQAASSRKSKRNISTNLKKRPPTFATAITLPYWFIL